MKNPFDKIKEKKEIERKRQEEEQQLRKDRLRQMEESKKEKTIIPHPIKRMQINKEIKELKAEIEYHDNKTKRRNLFIGCMIIWFLAMASMMFMPRNDKKSSEKVVTKGTKNEVVKTESTTQVKEEATTATLNTEATKATTTEEIENNDNYLTLDDISISSLSDYGHIDNDIIILGKDEGVTLTVEISNKDIKDEDIYVDYDKEMIKLESKEPYRNDNLTRFFYYVKGKKAGSTEFIVASNEEIQNKDDEAKVYVLEIKVLDEKEGKIVYETPTGEKYHYSSECAGENAIKTTYYDAVSGGYTPCGKCAQ